MLPCSDVLPLLCFLCLHAPVFFLVRLTVFKLFSVTALHALLHVFCWQYLHLFFCWLLSLYQRLCCHFPLPFALELNIGVFCTKWFCDTVRYSSSVAMKPNEDTLDCSVVSQSFSFCSFLFSFWFCYLSSSSPLLSTQDMRWQQAISPSQLPRMLWEELPRMEASERCGFLSQ